MRFVELNDLPRHMPKLKDILALAPRVFAKDEESLRREYDQDKWGRLRSDLARRGLAPTLDNACSLLAEGLGELPCYVRGRIALLSFAEYYALYGQLVRDTLLTHGGGSRALVELGCGFGQVILGVASQEAFSGCRVLAGDLTDGGTRLLEEIAREEGLCVEPFLCNFFDPGLTCHPIPRGATIFTSFAACCLPELGQPFIDALLALEPRAVVHFEPCYEHYDPDTLLGLLARRYVEINGYNTDLASLLRANQAAGRLRIVEESVPALGINPLFPQSVLAWKPSGEASRP